MSQYEQFSVIGHIEIEYKTTSNIKDLSNFHDYANIFPLNKPKTCQNAHINQRSAAMSKSMVLGLE
jgi:hypothetical protein